MRLRDRLPALHDAILRLARTHGAEDVRIFGSVARGEERADSDVDFLIRLSPGRTLLDVARLELSLEQLLGRSVDVVPEPTLREPLRSAALRDAIPV
jgi:predicted nucleotidyltransferase